MRDVAKELHVCGGLDILSSFTWTTPHPLTFQDQSLHIAGHENACVSKSVTAGSVVRV